MSYKGEKDTLRFRVSAYIAVAIAATGIATGAVFLHLLEKDRETVLKEHLTWMATGMSLLLSENMEPPDVAEVERIIRTFERTETSMYETEPYENMEYLEVLDPSGKVVAVEQSGLDEEETAFVVGMRSRAASAREPYFWDKDFEGGCRLYGLARPIVSDGKRLGTVNITVCDRHVRHVTMGYLKVGAMFLLAFGLTGILFGVRLAKWATRPLRRLAEGADRLSGGALGYRVDASGPAEMRSLAESFNSMASSLEQKVGELVEAREEAVSLSGKLTDSYENVKKSAERLEEANREANALASELESLNRALASEKKRTDTIVHSIRDGIIAVDIDEKVILLNPEAEDIFDISEEDAVGQPVGALVDRLMKRIEDPKAFREAFMKSASEPGLDSDVAITVTSPARKTYKRRSSAIRDENGRLLGRVVTFNDITREQEIDNMKSNFVSTVSHELRTPLTSIKGALTLLKDGQVKDQETRREFLQIAEYNADRLVNLISNLLDLSRMDSGMVSLNLSRMDIVSFVADFVERTPFMSGREDVRLTAEYPEGPVKVLGDRDKLEQVLANLLSNAYKFSPDGGLVGLKVYTGPEDVFIAVEDGGPGIPPDKLERVFDRFYQVDMSATRRYGGTGLGLSICRAIAREHGGDVHAESPVAGGRGARFTVRLPRVRQVTLDLGFGEEGGGEDREAAPKKTVLVADPDPRARKLHRKALEAGGYEVIEAVDGREALDMVKAKMPGLVLMDVNLPLMSGYEVAGALKAEEATAGIPVIFTSEEGGGPGPDETVRPCGYIPKPFGEEQLVSKVRECLGHG